MEGGEDHGAYSILDRGSPSGNQCKACMIGQLMIQPCLRKPCWWTATHHWITNDHQRITDLRQTKKKYLFFGKELAHFLRHDKVRALDPQDNLERVASGSRSSYRREKGRYSRALTLLVARAIRYKRRHAVTSDESLTSPPPSWPPRKQIQIPATSHRIHVSKSLLSPPFPFLHSLPTSQMMRWVAY